MSDKVGYLQGLCNKYGDFKVAKSFRGYDKEVIWSKHQSVLDLWQSDYGLKFLGEVNHRMIMPFEVILDIDEPDLKKFIDIFEDLDRHIKVYNNFSYEAYESGSRGYHIHITLNVLTAMPRHRRELMRELIIDKYQCDLQKKSDMCMIAIEHNPHWKTGNMKKLVKENRGVLDEI